VHATILLHNNYPGRKSPAHILPPVPSPAGRHPILNNHKKRSAPATTAPPSEYLASALRRMKRHKSLPKHHRAPAIMERAHTGDESDEEEEETSFDDDSNEKSALLVHEPATKPNGADHRNVASRWAWLGPSRGAQERQDSSPPSSLDDKEIALTKNGSRKPEAVEPKWRRPVPVGFLKY